MLVLKKWCGSEHDDGTRLAVAEGVARTLPFLHSHPSASGKTLGIKIEVSFKMLKFFPISFYIFFNVYIVGTFGNVF